MRRSARPWAMSFVIACCLGSCRPSVEGSDKAVAPASPSKQGLAAPYPRGRWRLVKESELGSVVLWFSHILIRHRDVVPRQLSFELPMWTAAPPAPDRSREEALELALGVAERAQGAPDEFEAMARELSEDVATREAGGSLGARRAFRLYRWPRVLDALATLGPGEVSRVVETEFGFHVFQRRSPPEERVVSGAHIVIGHNAAPWLQHLARSPLQDRPPSEALALAEMIYRKAVDDPASFPSLVAEYSEHRDAMRRGDFGAWSTRAGTSYPRAIELLSGLDVGGVAPPFDSLFGYQLVQRTGDRPRQRFAWRQIELRFDVDAAPSAARSRPSVTARISEIANILREHPSRFSEFQKIQCCSAKLSSLEGQGDTRFDAVLSELQPGQISAPLELENGFAILKRLPDTEFEEPRVLFELPAPQRPDIEALIARGYSQQLGAAWREIEAALDLPADDAARMGALHAAAASRHDSTRKQRAAAYQELQQNIREVLGAKRYAEYMDGLAAYFERAVLYGAPGGAASAQAGEPPKERSHSDG